MSNLAHSRNRLERIAILAELRLSRLLDQWPDSERHALTLSKFRDDAGTLSSELPGLLAPHGRAEQAVRDVHARFNLLTAGMALPFPAYYNADTSFGMFCYGFTRMLRPNIVFEVGVGYGTSSALILHALAENRQGRLISLDMPPLGDYRGVYTGMVVPETLRERWMLHRDCSSRKSIRPLLQRCSSVDVFVGDGGSVSTLQQYELRSVWPYLVSGGWAIINNAAPRLLKCARELPDARVFPVWQTQKTGCITALIEKRPLGAEAEGRY